MMMMMMSDGGRIGGGVGVEVEVVDFAHVFAGDPGPHICLINVVCAAVVDGVAIGEI